MREKNWSPANTIGNSAFNNLKVANEFQLDGYVDSKATYVENDYVIKDTDFIVILVNGGTAITYDGANDPSKNRVFYILNPYAHDYTLNGYSTNVGMIVGKNAEIPGGFFAQELGGDGVSKNGIFTKDNNGAIIINPNIDNQINAFKVGANDIINNYNSFFFGLNLDQVNNVDNKFLIGKDISCKSGNVMIVGDTITDTTGTGNTDILTIGKNITLDNSKHSIILGRDINLTDKEMTGFLVSSTNSITHNVTGRAANVDGDTIHGIEPEGYSYIPLISDKDTVMVTTTIINTTDESLVEQFQTPIYIDVINDICTAGSKIQLQGTSNASVSTSLTAAKLSFSVNANQSDMTVSMFSQFNIIGL